jgi:DNA-binding beta-propeller fold protein YncE
MRNLSLSPRALSVCVAATLLTACGGSQGTSSTIPGSGITQTSSRPLSDLARTGIAPKFWPLLRIGAVPAGHHPTIYKGLKDLYVSDMNFNAVEILANRTYKNVGSISNGINGPGANFLDKKGNLYVANTGGGSSESYIREYAPGATSPSFTYTAGMTDPVGVTVDAAGNVYETDHLGGFVNEYAQGINAVLHSCPVVGPVGVAVDASGDVFVDTATSTGANILEYFGLAMRGHPPRCQFSTLGVTLDFGGGMVLDNNNALVVCDQTLQSVYIIAPPYSSITRTLGSDYIDPYQVALTKYNALAFVTDVGLDEVFVYNYKTNTLVTTLGSGNGISLPFGAVDGPNAVH